MATVLFALFILLGAIYIVLTILTYPQYQDEISQRLNRRLAEYFVADKDFFRSGVVSHGRLDEAFKTLMHINPNVEAYFLDTRGAIVDFSAPPEKVRRKSVSLEPIFRFLHDN